MTSESNRMYILFKCTQNILPDRSHLGHKTSLNKYKKTEIISSIFSEHNTMRLDINYRKKKTAKYTKARPYIFIMYYKNRIMLTGENKTQTSKKQASKCKLGRKNKQSNQNMIQPNFYHVESSFSPVQFSRSVMSDSVIP